MGPKWDKSRVPKVGGAAAVKAAAIVAPAATQSEPTGHITHSTVSCRGL